MSSLAGTDDYEENLLSKSSLPAFATSGGGTKEDSIPTPPNALTALVVLVVIAAVTKGLTAATASSAFEETAGPISAGNTAWMLVATSFVLLMTPGLALFEAGLLRAKNSASTIAQCFVGMSVLSVLWAVCGFSACFGPTNVLGGALGSPWDHFLLRGVGWSTSLKFAPTIPGVLYAAFQGMFASIAPLLVTGAFSERLKFKGFLSFSVLWSVLCYYPMCRAVWGGGALAQAGVLDFAGGIVIHTVAGVASLVTAVALGPRSSKTAGDEPAESNLPLATVGAGMLWMGWFGFNAGSSVSSGALAANTLLVSHLAACSGALVWAALDWTTGTDGKPTLVGLLNGTLSGLAGVTPASGFVHAPSGLTVGALCGLGSYYGVHLLRDKAGIDDALEVSSVHGVTGILGSLAIGLYGSTAINADGADGLFFGGGVEQLNKQALGVVVACVWSLVTTTTVIALLQWFDLFKVDKDTETSGLDVTEHGEIAYQM